MKSIKKEFYKKLNIFKECGLLWKSSPFREKTTYFAKVLMHKFGTVARLLHMLKARTSSGVRKTKRRGITEDE